MLDEALLLLPQELGVARKVADARAGIDLCLPPSAGGGGVGDDPAVNGGLTATAADDWVVATTTTSRLRAAMAERVMAIMVGSGVAATTATYRLRSVATEQAMALAFNDGVAAGISCQRAAAAEHVVGVLRTPNRDATRTTLRRGLHRRHGVASQLELSSDDGGVAKRR